MFEGAESGSNISPDFHCHKSHTYRVLEYPQHAPMYCHLGVPEVPGIPGVAPH